MKYFERVTPESVGIASKGILEFLEGVRRKGIELHSFMVLRHDKCAAAGWWKPYGPEFLHPLYSFSKTFTATAIGFARQEGLLSLDEKLVDLFPEQCPENPSENLKKVTLHHVLCMGCGHETEMMDRTENWISLFLNHPVLHEPGTFYKYNTPGTNMLAAVIKKKTGLNVTEYLRPRLLEPLGITDLVCEKLPDGVELGGGAMKLQTEGMAKFATFLLHKGCWEGKQLLEESWFDLAVVKQIETAGDSEGHIKDWAHGYGYQCWMCVLPGSYRADGAYGQFGFVFPSIDTIVVTTTSTEQTQTLVDILNEKLLPAIGEEVLPESFDAKILEHVIENLEITPLLGDRNPDLEKRLEGKVFAAEEGKKCSGLQHLVGGAGYFQFDMDKKIEKMSFSFQDDMITWHVWENGQEKCVSLPLDGRFEYSKCDETLYAATARYRQLNSIEMEIRRVDAISGVRMIFDFTEKGLSFRAEDTLISVGGLGIVDRNVCSFVIE